MASKAAPAKKPAATTPPSQAVVKRDSKANNYIAVIAVVTVLVVLVCGLAAKSLLGSIILDGKLIVHTNQAKTDLDTKLRNIPILISNYNALGSKQQLIADALPNDPDFPALISIAQAMSADSGLTLKSISPDNSASNTAVNPGAVGAAVTPGATTSVSSTKPTPYLFDVEVAGTYPQVVHFFDDVQLSARPMKVVNTDFNGDGSALQVSIILQTYYQGAANTNDKTETLK
ncbi:MAG TPA: hypothetical protein VMR75_01015 [Candidatus Saccharimonadales bacterium]|nr:hypothetical protein [Candidatus Saccharimonadales bacterium]